MTLSGSKSRLTALTKAVALQWDDTKNHWRDAKSLEFERRYLQELLAYVDRTVMVIEKLDELLKNVRSDCE